MRQRPPQIPAPSVFVDDVIGPDIGRPLLRKTIKLATYNIHNGIGRDRRYDLHRIAEVIRMENPDIIALQEVDDGLMRSRLDNQSRLLGEWLGMHECHCVTMPCEWGGFGIAVLSRFPLAHKERFDITHPAGRESRHCLRVDVEIAPDALLHIFNCHLGLDTREREWQQRQMLSDAILLSRDLEHPVALLGDFNDRFFQVVHQRMRQYFKDAFITTGKRFGATFRMGMLKWKLDHIYLSPDVRVLDSWVQRQPPANIASDHRPLVALVDAEWLR